MKKQFLFGILWFLVVTILFAILFKPVDAYPLIKCEIANQQLNQTEVIYVEAVPCGIQAQLEKDANLVVDRLRLRGYQWENTKIIIGSNVNKLASSAYQISQQSSPEGWQRYLDSFQYGGFTYPLENSVLIVAPTNRGWYGPSLQDWRIKVLAHELIHAAQYNQSCHQGGAPSLIVEGEASLMSDLLFDPQFEGLTDLNQLPVQETYRPWLLHLLESETSIDQLYYNWQHGKNYPTAEAFTLYLLTESPKADELGLILFTYWQLFCDVPPGDHIFKATFGWEIKDALRGFDDWRAETLDN